MSTCLVQRCGRCLTLSYPWRRYASTATGTPDGPSGPRREGEKVGPPSKWARVHRGPPTTTTTTPNRERDRSGPGNRSAAPPTDRYRPAQRSAEGHRASAWNGPRNAPTVSGGRSYPRPDHSSVAFRSRDPQRPSFRSGHPQRPSFGYRDPQRPSFGSREVDAGRWAGNGMRDRMDPSSRGSAYPRSRPRSGLSRNQQHGVDGVPRVAEEGMELDGLGEEGTGQASTDKQDRRLKHLKRQQKLALAQKQMAADQEEGPPSASDSQTVQRPKERKLKVLQAHSTKNIFIPKVISVHNLAILLKKKLGSSLSALLTINTQIRAQSRSSGR